VGTDSTRVGIVQFSGKDKADNANNEFHHTLEIPLTVGTTRAQVNKALDNMRWHAKGDGGSELADPMTYTGEAIHHVLTNEHMFPSARKDSKHMLVIVTDGKSNSKNKEFDVKKMSDNARAQKIEVIAVGIAINKKAEKKELTDMADDEENVFLWDEYSSDMSGLVKKLSEYTNKKICTYGKTQHPTETIGRR